jgi:ferredoxin
VKVLADESKCAGCGQCVLAAPNVFDQDAERAMVMVLDANPPESEWAGVRNARAWCPTSAISLEGDDATGENSGVLPATQVST